MIVVESTRDRSDIKSWSFWIKVNKNTLRPPKTKKNAAHINIQGGEAMGPLPSQNEWDIFTARLREISLVGRFLDGKLLVDFCRKYYWRKI